MGREEEREGALSQGSTRVEFAKDEMKEADGETERERYTVSEILGGFQGSKTNYVRYSHVDISVHSFSRLSR